MLGLHPDLDYDVIANDAVAAVAEFIAALGLRGDEIATQHGHARSMRGRRG